MSTTIGALSGAHRRLRQQMVESKPQLRQDGLLWGAIERFGEILLWGCYLRWLDETIEMVEAKFREMIIKSFLIT